MNINDCGALCLLLIAASASADDFHLIDVDKVYVDYMHYTYAAEPFMYNAGYTPTNRLDVHLDLKLFDGIGFIDNMIHSETDQSQYRVVGWNYRMGAHVGNNLDIYFEHYSQHLLDSPTVGPNSFDALGVRVYLYKAKQ